MVISLRRGGRPPTTPKKTPEERRAEEEHAVEEAKRRGKMKKPRRRLSSLARRRKGNLQPSQALHHQTVQGCHLAEAEALLHQWWQLKKPTTPMPKFKTSKLTQHERERVSRLDPQWQGVITACLELGWPFPFVFTVEELAKLDDIRRTSTATPQMKTLHELGIFLGTLFSDSSFNCSLNLRWAPPTQRTRGRSARQPLGVVESLPRQGGGG